MRPEGVLAVAAEVNSGAEVTICSASPALVLQPWADKLGIKLIGTQLEVKDGKLTGRITGHNCRCAQKVARLEKVYGDLNAYHLRAWGDTRGDHELLAAAQEDGRVLSEPAPAALPPAAQAPQFTHQVAFLPGGGCALPGLHSNCRPGKRSATGRYIRLLVSPGTSRSQ